MSITKQAFFLTAWNLPVAENSANQNKRRLLCRIIFGKDCTFKDISGLKKAIMMI